MKNYDNTTSTKIPLSDMIVTLRNEAAKGNEDAICILGFISANIPSVTD